jgi:hypothetical protein
LGTVRGDHTPAATWGQKMKMAIGVTIAAEATF